MRRDMHGNPGRDATSEFLGGFFGQRRSCIRELAVRNEGFPTFETKTHCYADVIRSSEVEFPEQPSRAVLNKRSVHGTDRSEGHWEERHVVRGNRGPATKQGLALRQCM